MPLGSILNRAFQFPRLGNTNMADEQICEVGLTLAPKTLGPFNEVMHRFLENKRIHRDAII
jgi:hypothetical protein